MGILIEATTPVQTVGFHARIDGLHKCSFTEEVSEFDEGAIALCLFHDPLFLHEVIKSGTLAHISISVAVLLNGEEGGTLCKFLCLAGNLMDGTVHV